VADQLPEKQRDRIGDRSALGDYISIAEHSHLELAVPVDRLRWINKMRNDAAHRGAAPSNWDAGNAVQVMIDFLGAHGSIRRTGKREPDGGDWVLAEAEGDDADGAQLVEEGPDTEGGSSSVRLGVRRTRRVGAAFILVGAVGRASRLGVGIAERCRQLEPGISGSPCAMFKRCVCKGLGRFSQPSRRPGQAE
jgi:hypothetical protein